MMKIIEENAENRFDSKIELTDTYTKVFTTREVIEHRDNCKAVIVRANQQFDIFNKQDEMALEILPELADIKEKDYSLIKAWIERKQETEELKNVVTQYEKVIEEYNARIEEIKELGIKIEEIEVKKAE